MNIHTLEYTDNAQEWKINKLDFFNLTLLVGISGVGKTQILRSIMSLKNIAKGKSYNGVAWDVSFSNKEMDYSWKGEFEMLNERPFIENYPVDLFDDEEKIKPKLISESIYLNNTEIASRDKDEIFFEGKKMPKLSSEESLVSIFKEEDKVKGAIDGFKKIIFRDHTSREGIRLSSLDVSKIKDKYKTIEELKASDLDTISKLYWLSEEKNELFLEIKERYVDVFPQVVDVKVSPIEDDDLPLFFRESPIIHIKEKGVESWIPQNRISSGMLRTFLHISEMYLLEEGTVILIDEFENSLGVNCINTLTEDLIFENSKIQFIATSHHPYIINKIPYEYWKIVARNKGEIVTHDAKNFKLGESHHERFMNLINLQEYKQGIFNS